MAAVNTWALFYCSAPVNTGRIVQQLLPQRPYIAQLLLTHGPYCSAAVYKWTLPLLLNCCNTEAILLSSS